MRERTGRRGDGRDARTGSGRLLAVGVATIALLAAVAIVASGGWILGGAPDADPGASPTAGPEGSSASTAEGGDAPTTTAGSDETASTSTDGTQGSTTETDDGTASTATDESAIAIPPSGRESLADARTTIAGRGNDELGYSVATGDANGDGTTDVLVGAPLHNATGKHSGAAFLFYGPVDDGNLTAADADVTFEGTDAGDWAGNAVRLVDVDGDGTDDVVVGAPRSDAGGDTAGAVYVTYGGDLPGTVALADADARIFGAEPGSFAGYSIDAADVDGEDGADLLIGAPRADVSGEESGAAYLVAGGDLPSETTLADATATFAGAAAGDRAGRSVAVAGDVDGDGRADPVVGAWRNDSTANNAGAAYVLTGDLDGSRSLADAAVTLTGASAGDVAGWSVADAGDVNGDGHADVLVGAPFEDTGGSGAGAAYVVYGGPDLPDVAALPDVGSTLVGAAGSDNAGYVVASVGDATCDGQSDLLVGAPENDTGGDNAGAAYLVSGATLGENVTSLADEGLALTGAEAGDRVGHANQLGAVRSEDGVELLVGAPWGDVPPTLHVVSRECPA